jgi:hypothetical protein
LTLASLPRALPLGTGEVTDNLGSSFGGGLNLLLVAGAAYFAWEHEQGRHGRPHVLCPLCWLNKIAPAPEASDGPSAAEPPEQA